MAPGGSKAEAARRELERILGSPGFARNERLSRFLRFVVGQHLTGHDAELKESVIAVEVFGRNPDFNPKRDPIVRTEAARLRARLNEYYLNGGLSDSLIIELPKGGYTPAFRQRDVGPDTVGPRLNTTSKPKRAWLTVIIIALMGLAAAVTRWWPRELATLDRVTLLTAFPGSEVRPSLSPDGRLVAFSWNGPSKNNFDIYVQVVGGAGPPLRLTSDPADDMSPAWSPDGRNIAFFRAGANGGTVFLISPLGGSERPLTRAGHASVAWTSDGLQLGIVDREASGSRGPFKLFLVSIASGERRPLTAPPDNVEGDTDMAFSPDARTVAFVRRARTIASDLYVAPVQSPPGEARRLTFDQGGLYGVSWLPDSRSLLISSSRAGAPELWRVDAERSRIRGRQYGPERVSAAQAFARFPSVSARARSAGWQVAYEVLRQDYNIWRLRADPARRFKPERLIASTRSDEDPQYSPDDSKIAFSSDRSGSPEIWICEADGSSPRQLTFLRGGSVGAPRWSPDGSVIAFDALVAGNRNIYAIAAAGGVLSRLTHGSSNEARPSWSADGQWIYFRSNPSGRHEIWKVRVSPKGQTDAIQVTHAGGFEAFESTDGKTVYYVKGLDRLGLWSMPADGGAETLLHPWVRDGAWAVAERGIYFINFAGMRTPLLSAAASYPIEFLGFGHETARLGEIERAKLRYCPGFSVSHDGQWILWAQLDGAESDLMLADNVR